MSSSGFLLIHKPTGPTSHDIINQLRRITGVKKIGHAGTLDPFAEGLLIVAVGREATRQISQFVKLDKEYIATLKLGKISDTYDRTGKITEIKNSLSSRTPIRDPEIKNVLQNFIGKQEQIPPMYSAKKVAGKKLYELARKGIEIERQPCQIEVYDIVCVAGRRFPNLRLKKTDYSTHMLETCGRQPHLILKIHCSSGTYIRSLAHDIGQALGCGAYLEKLVRTKIGKFKLTDAIELDKLNNENWQNYFIK